MGLDLGFIRVQELRVKSQGLGFRVQGSEFSI
jgi:hypothetical protein